MQKTTGRQIITTINFVGNASESTVWTEAEARDEWIIDEYADAHRENAADASYTAEYGQADTFEYELPGLRVVVLLAGDEVMTVWTVEDVDATRLHKAVRREQPVTITYTKADGTGTVRTIEPTALRLTKAGDTIVKAMDRDSGEARTFRLDRVSAYTVHRTRRTVRTGTPAPTKAQLWESWKSRSRVLIVSRGWTGRIVEGSRGLSASGWSVVVDLDGAYRHHSPSGSLRVSEDELWDLANLDRLARAAG